MPSALGRHLALRGWSDGMLARRTGLNRAHVNDVKNGYAHPTIATALRIAHALGVTVESVFPTAPLSRGAARPRRGARGDAPGRSHRAATSSG